MYATVSKKKKQHTITDSCDMILVCVNKQVIALLWVTTSLCHSQSRFDQ